MVVNATTVFWEDLPPTSAPPGQLITVTGRITNTGTEEQDFRLSVQMVGIGAGIFPVPMEIWSTPIELSPGEIYTAHTSFSMPNYGVQLTIQAEWYNRAGAPAQWVKVGATASRNVALVGVTPEFPVGAPPTPSMVQPVRLQIPTGMILLLFLGAGALMMVVLRRK